MGQRISLFYENLLSLIPSDKTESNACKSMVMTVVMSTCKEMCQTKFIMLLCVEFTAAKYYGTYGERNAKNPRRCISAQFENILFTCILLFCSQSFQSIMQKILKFIRTCIPPKMHLKLKKILLLPPFILLLTLSKLL